MAHDYHTRLSKLGDLCGKVQCQGILTPKSDKHQGSGLRTGEAKAFDLLNQKQDQSSSLHLLGIFYPVPICQSWALQAG